MRDTRLCQMTTLAICLLTLSGCWGDAPIATATAIPPSASPTPAPTVTSTATITPTLVPTQRVGTSQRVKCSSH